LSNQKHPSESSDFWNCRIPSSLVPPMLTAKIFVACRSRGTPHHSQLGASSSNGEWHRRAWDLVKIPFWWCFSAHMESCCFYTYYTYKHQYLVDLNLVFFHTCFLKKRYLQCSTAGSVTFHPRNSDNSPTLEWSIVYDEPPNSSTWEWLRYVKNHISSSVQNPLSCLPFIFFLISQFRDCDNPQYTSDQEGAEMKNPNLEIAMNHISIFLGVTSLEYNTL